MVDGLNFNKYLDRGATAGVCIQHSQDIACCALLNAMGITIIPWIFFKKISAQCSI